MIEIIAVGALAFIWGYLTGAERYRPKRQALPAPPSIGIAQLRFERDASMWTERTIRHTARGPGVYNAGSSVGAEVWDVDRVEKLQKIVEIDTNENTLTFAAWPLRVKGDEIETYKVRYRKIHAISDGGDWAVLFHCYGRITNG